MNAAPTSAMAVRRSTASIRPPDAKFMAVGALEPQFYAEFLRCSNSRRIPPRSRPAHVAAAANQDQRRLRRTPTTGVGEDIQRQRRLRGARARHGRCAGHRDWQPVSPFSSATA